MNIIKCDYSFLYDMLGSKFKKEFSYGIVFESNDILLNYRINIKDIASVVSPSKVFSLGFDIVDISVCVVSDVAYTYSVLPDINDKNTYYGEIIDDKHPLKTFVGFYRNKCDYVKDKLKY